MMADEERKQKQKSSPSASQSSSFLEGIILGGSTVAAVVIATKFARNGNGRFFSVLSRAWTSNSNTMANTNTEAATLSMQQQQMEMFKALLQKYAVNEQHQIHSLLSNLRQEVTSSICNMESRIGTKLQNQERHIGDSMCRHSSDLNERLDLVNATRTELGHAVRKMEELHSIFKYSPKKRGAFGEMQLENILMEVMHPGSYSFQQTLSNGKRVDCLLELPPPVGKIAVDSKFPLDAFLEMTVEDDGNQDNNIYSDSGGKSSGISIRNDDSDAPNKVESNFHHSINGKINGRNDNTNIKERKDEMHPKTNITRKKIESHLRKHIRDVATKYIISGETADSAILFIPSESIFAELAREHPSVFVEANRSRVWIACPTTLLAVLTTMQGAVRGMAITQHATTIVHEVHGLTKDIERLFKRQESVERSLESARKNLESMRISIDKIQRRKTKLDSFSIIDKSTEAPHSSPSTTTKSIMTGIDTNEKENDKFATTQQS